MAKPAVTLRQATALFADLVPELNLRTPAPEGEDRRAFAGDLGGVAVIVRFDHDSRGFALDELAGQLCSGVVPVPAVLMRATVDIGAGGQAVSFCVSEYVEGTTLQDLGDSDLAASLEPTSRLLDAVAEVRVETQSGAGPIHPDGTASCGGWPDHIAGIARLEWSCLPDAERTQVERVAAKVAAADVPSIRQLVHGDFGSNNVLYRDGEIVAVLDWDQMMIGDPLWDVANIWFWSPHLNCMNALRNHLLTIANDLDQELLRIYQQCIGLQEIAAAARSGNDAWRQWLLHRTATL